MAKIPSSTCNPLNCVITDVLTQPDAELAALEQRQGKTRALDHAIIQEPLTGKTSLP